MRKIKSIAIVVVAIIGLWSITATSGSDSKSGSSSDSGGSSQKVYKVGETAHSGDFDITLQTVKNPYQPTNQFEQASAGKHFVATEFTVKNTASEQKTFSSLLGAEVSDSSGQHFSITLAGTDLPQLDGDVAANDIRRGWMVFEVPDASSGLKIRLKGDLTSTGSLFALS